MSAESLAEACLRVIPGDHAPMRRVHASSSRLRLIRGRRVGSPHLPDGRGPSAPRRPACRPRQPAASLDRPRQPLGRSWYLGAGSPRESSALGRCAAAASRSPVGGSPRPGQGGFTARVEPGRRSDSKASSARFSCASPRRGIRRPSLRGPGPSCDAVRPLTPLQREGGRSPARARRSISPRLRCASLSQPHTSHSLG